MTLEEIEAVWLDVKRLYEHSVPNVYPAAYERLRKPFDLALQALDRDAVLEQEVWEDAAQQCRYYLKHQNFEAEFDASKQKYVKSEFAQAVAITCENLEKIMLEKSALKREPSAARLGQGWVPVAWMVTWNGETTDDIFCIKEAAIECMARRNRDYPNDTRTIVPLAIIPPVLGASDE